MADDRLLLESFSRPENLIEYQLKRTIDFEIDEHRKRLAEVETAVNPGVVPVGDGAGDPVVLTCHPTDRVELTDLATTGDAAFNKIIIVLTALCDEVAFLRSHAESKYFAQLSLFGHSKEDDNAEYGEGVLEAMMGRSLPVLKDAAAFSARCATLVLHLVHQLAAIYGRASPFSGAWREVKLRPVFLALGDVMTLLITMDTIVRNNRMFSAAWEKYKRMVDVMRSDPAKYGGDAASAAALDALLLELDRGVATGNTFRRCLDQAYDPLPASDPSGNDTRDLLLVRCLENVDWLLSSVASDFETAEATQVVGQFAIYALYRSLTMRVAPDRKVFERLWKVTDRLPMTVLFTKYVWMPDIFLLEYAGFPGLDPRRLTPRDGNAVREAAASEMIDGIPVFADRMYTRLTAWMVRAAAAFAQAPLCTSGTRVDPLLLLRERATLVTQGVCMIHLLSRQVSMFLNFHLHLSRDFKKKSIEPLARCCEMIKALEAAIKTHNLAIAETLQHVTRDNAAELLNKVLPLRLMVTTARGASSDVLRTISAATELIEGMAVTTESWVPSRRVMLQLAASVATQKGGLSKDADVGVITRSLWMLGLLSEYHTMVRAAADCSVLYWLRELLPALTACAATVDGPGGPGDADSRQGGRLHYLFAAFSDAAKMLGRIVHLPPPPPPGTRLAVAAGSVTIKPVVNAESPFAGIDHLLSAYEVYLHGILRADVVHPLCRAVETDLRVHIHAVHLAHMEPPSLKAGKPPLVHLLRLPPLRVLNAVFDIKTEVTHYLEKCFYELTTVALHDWKTYGEMASLAADKYGLILTDNHLPMGCLDSGLDVLQIMRNIHIFVGRFNYNINQQFFVEKKGSKGAKHIKAVTIDSISASIRQHGTGMMNTTVNFAYQFLSKKFYIFSQFLYDEYIKSYLMKERRYFRRERKALENRYPYDHAIDLNRDIRRLGMTEDKQSFLDKFRQLISEIGNALGYVRMVRTAGMHAASEAVKFVPDLKDLKDFSFEDAARAVHVAAKTAEEEAAAGAAGGAASADAPASAPGAGLSAETLEAARTLDAVLRNLVGSFSESVDYFTLLVGVFQHVLLESEKKQAEEAAAAAAATSAAAPPPPPPGSAAAATPAVAGDGTAGGAASDKKDAAGKKGGAGGKDAASKEGGHLRNFFLIIPALTVNFIENLRNAKDRMEKSVKGMEAFFCDDGFAMGIAYILAILRQDRAFESLHWWDSVTRFHNGELVKCSNELATLGKTKADSDKRDELEFKRKRIAADRREFEALFFAYRGARTFFRDADTGKGGDSGTKDDDEDAIAAAV